MTTFADVLAFATATRGASYSIEDYGCDTDGESLGAAAFVETLDHIWVFEFDDGFDAPITDAYDYDTED